jgi:hypothetical protein
MAREVKALDVTDTPELLRVAEEVQRTKQPRLLQREQQDVAMIVPVTPPASITVALADPDNIWANYDPERMRAALKKSAGALARVDGAQLVKDIYEARDQDPRTRPG